MNYNFFVSMGKSPSEIQEQTNKKCSFSMCETCTGEGGPSEPCCTEGCEELDIPEAREVPVDESEDWGKDDYYVPDFSEWDPVEDDSFANPFMDPGFNPDGGPKAESSTTREKQTTSTHRSTTTTTTMDPLEAALADGQVCARIPVKACPRGSRNMGKRFEKAGKPMCCKSAAGSEKAGADCESMDAMDNLKKAPEDQDPRFSLSCKEGSTFRFQNTSVSGMELDICMDQDGLPADKVCCEDGVRELAIAQQVAMAECAKVSVTDCGADVEVFEKARSSHPKVPESFTCKQMFLCVGSGETFGPVMAKEKCDIDVSELAQQRHPEITCAALSK
eukprot:CAMPEP_0178434316 /NCGR_PEP_ID=MMETSP0689_2-20121128/33361_1 /TAXON_ID=160604 /ORGANISM="Amphidinium massartii, Strain CS-259" /LENGTH=332 /DNA_ID=CAMNT_0020056377 /DNA_START=83 /DNA_END=1081 /DNA_ORIENTATION=+